MQHVTGYTVRIVHAAALKSALAGVPREIGE